MRLWRWAGVVCVGLVACVSGDGLQNKLRDATDGYARSMRWADYDRAAEYLPAASQAGFLAQFDDLWNELVIVDFELLRLDLDPQSGVAALRAKVLWHLDRELVVKTTEIDQLWQFHEGRFVLVDERMHRGDGLAIVAEPDVDPHPYLPGLEAFRKHFAIGEENKPSLRSRKRRHKASKSSSG